MKKCNKCEVSKPLSDFYKGYGRCKECLLTYMRSLRIENPDKFRDSVTKSRLKRNFGMTVEDYDAILEKQSNVCAICHGPQNGSRMYQLCVDHCHKTGRIRGLLCNNCNVGLGRFKDNKYALSNAIEYLA